MKFIIFNGKMNLQIITISYHIINVHQKQNKDQVAIDKDIVIQVKKYIIISLSFHFLVKNVPYE